MSQLGVTVNGIEYHALAADFALRALRPPRCFDGLPDQVRSGPRMTTEDWPTANQAIVFCPMHRLPGLESAGIACA
jgi:hypothetical protein